jgi:hypothetical protein
MAVGVGCHSGNPTKLFGVIQNNNRAGLVFRAAGGGRADPDGAKRIFYDPTNNPPESITKI